MLHSRLRPLLRPRNTTAVPPPAFHSEPGEQEQPDPDEVEEEDPEELFSAFLPHLFPDDAPSFHGDPGQHLLYASPSYGNLEIMVPSYPSKSEDRTDGEVNDVEEGRKLFAHFLWSAAMVVAEGVERAASPASASSTSSVRSRVKGGDEIEMWRADGEKVLELGAGAALPSIICALANASSVTITDHPSSPALNGAIAFNVKHNLELRAPSCPVSIRPHEWGKLDSDPWALEHKGTFTRIIAADCFWMSSQHGNLARTMKWFLAPGGKVWVVAGFHTGRAIVAGFFETVVRIGLEVERIYERDLNSMTEDGDEVRREWVAEREGEGPENRRRWCVVALLRHA